MWIRLLDNHLLFGVPLFVILLGGLVGILVDLDHPIAYYLLKNPNGRFLHGPMFIVGCVIFGGVISCCAGLYAWMVLSGRR